MKNKLKILAELTKIRITSFVTVTTVLGYVSFAGKLSLNMILPVAGILLLACGSAVINHYQERYSDALMDRTKNRPIPSGRITAKDSLLIAIILSVAGLSVLILSGGILAASLALLNLVWYNGIYTPLKKINPMAIIPGSIVGAIPPMVGWVAAGGYIFDPQIIIIAFFFFIWQIPHFWLLLLVLDKDYQQAGFPTLTTIFNHDQLARITFIWIVATVVTGILIPLFGIIKVPYINFALFGAGAWLTFKSFRLITGSNEKYYFRFAFREINIFALIVILLISIDKIIL